MFTNNDFNKYIGILQSGGGSRIIIINKFNYNCVEIINLINIIKNSLK